MAQMSRDNGGVTEYAYARIKTNGMSPEYRGVEWHPGAEDEKDGESVKYKGASNEERLVSIPDYVVLPWVEILASDEGGGQYSYVAQFDDEKKYEDQMSELRAERDRRLAECDWMVARHRDEEDDSDKTPTWDTSKYQEWLDYRQALRDMPADPGLNLDDPAWPSQPA